MTAISDMVESNETSAENVTESEDQHDPDACHNS